MTKRKSSSTGISTQDLLSAGGGCQVFIDILNSNKNGETVYWHINDNSIGLNQTYIEYINMTIDAIDDTIDLDFEQVNNISMSNIIINLEDYSNQDYLGLVYTERDRDFNYWTEMDIVDYSTQGVSSDDNKNTFIHEFGHALGLGEPGYDKRWDQDDTAMSYNKGEIGWQTWYTESDLNALISVWGLENDDSETKAVDLNNDGFVDGITNYQLWTEVGGIDLKNRRGKTFSDNTSGKWNAVKAVNIDNQFYILVESEKGKKSKFKVISADEEGIINAATRWLTGDQMLDEGYEDLLALDFNGNSQIGF